MVHPPSVCSIEVDLTRVLWLTRGRRWSYAFLLKPLLSPDDEWINLQARFFEYVTALETPYSVSGHLRAWPHRERSFVATTFLDPRRFDDEGRRVRHELVWFVPDGAPTPLVVPSDWGPRLVEAMAPAYDAAFEVDRADDGTEPGLAPIEAVRRAFADALAHLSPRVRIEGAAVMLYALRPIAVHRVELAVAPPRSPYTLGRALLVWAATFVALLLLGLALRRGS